MERVCIGKLETVSISRDEFRKLAIENIMEGDIMSFSMKEGPPAISLALMMAGVGIAKDLEKALFGECTCEICRGGAVILHPERVASCGPRKHKLHARMPG